MKCERCGDELKENELQLSHDVPKYMGGTDADGRHYACKKCHDIYEKIAFSVAWKFMPKENFSKIKKALQNFAKRWFND